MSENQEPQDGWTIGPDRAGELLADMNKVYIAAETARANGLPEPTRPTDADGKPIAGPEKLFLSKEERDERHLADAKNYLEANGFPQEGTAEGDDLWGKIQGKSEVSPQLQAQVERKLTS